MRRALQEGMSLANYIAWLIERDNRALIRNRSDHDGSGSSPSGKHPAPAPYLIGAALGARALNNAARFRACGLGQTAHIRSNAESLENPRANSALGR
jgi:hypothetical protein